MSLVAWCGAVVASGCLFPTEQEHDTVRRVGEFQTVASVQETVLLPLADTYLRQGAPNQNQGADPVLRLQASGNNRALLRFDRAALAAAVGAGTLQGARLELSIVVNADNWGTAGRTIDLHRLTQAWTEGGATWNCAEDANPGNQSADCEGETAWEMGGSGPHPWEPVPAATATITNGLTGVVSLDVTAELAAVLAGGGEHPGWILKKTQEGQPGRVEFGSRESGAPPRLVLEMEVGDTSLPAVPETPNLPDDSTFTVQSPDGTEAVYYRNIVVVTFDDSVSGVTVRQFLAKYGGTIIGGSEARDEISYYVQIPDPGPIFASLDSVTTLMSAEPGVQNVYNPTWRGRVRIRARFPTDGEGATRSDWFSSTNATRGLVSIRAPLAWGCETGGYGVRPRLGIIDWAFNGHRDLAVAETVVPSAVLLQNLTIDELEHGNKVAGIAAATGDNGDGIAGVAWQSDLHQYALGNQVFTARNFLEEYTKAFERARKTGVRVLNSSLSVGDVGKDSDVKKLQQSLEKYLQAGNVFVYAIGNLPRRLAVGQVGATKDTAFTALDRAVALARERFAGQIITVAGTGVNGALLPGSDFWLGGTDIAAPGEDILTLAHTADATTVAESGNSFAAPFVAGTAALLLAMDPTLTAAEVKDYILRGARVPRLDPATGDSVPADSVAGAPEMIYQLDAYGALSLLSAERPGTPVCGFPVSTRAGDLVLERPAGEERFALDPFDAHSPSIAQGGRLIAVNAGGVRVLDHRGVVRQTLAPPVVERRYLERDTVDVIIQPAPGGLGFETRFTFRPARAGVPTLYNPFSLVEAEELEGDDVFFHEFSPTGDSVAIGALYPGSKMYRWDLITIRTGAVSPLRQWPQLPDEQNCTGACPRFSSATARWSPSGRQLLLLQPERLVEFVPPGEPLSREPSEFSAVGSAAEDRTTVVTVEAGRIQETVVPDWQLLHPLYSPDDSTVVFREMKARSDPQNDGGLIRTCDKAVRPASALTQWRHSVPVVVEECEGDHLFGVTQLLGQPAVALLRDWARPAGVNADSAPAAAGGRVPVRHPTRVRVN